MGRLEPENGGIVVREQDGEWVELRQGHARKRGKEAWEAASWRWVAVARYSWHWRASLSDERIFIFTNENIGE